MKKFIFLCACVLALGFLFVSCSKSSAPSGPVTFDWDKGPVDTVEAEIAKYPKEYQDTYNNIIKTKCTACHSIARVLWAPYFDDDTWQKIVNKMANRPGSQVTQDDIGPIVKFIEYDHQQRKAEIEKEFQTQGWQQKPPVGI
jgi:hypothetical protein